MTEDAINRLISGIFWLRNSSGSVRITMFKYVDVQVLHKSGVVFSRQPE
jgi:hypothetical protein